MDQGRNQGGRQQRPYVERCFKAMEEGQIERMREEFFSSYSRCQNDNFYFEAFQAKARGDTQFIATPHTLKAKDAKETVNYEDAGLGAIRLRHTSTSQPLVNDDTINFTLPFEATAIRLEQLWNYLLQLEDIGRNFAQPSGNKKKNLLTFVVHSIQVNVMDRAAKQVDAADHMRFAYFMNDAKGQKFLSRFMVMLDQSLLKRFFFTAFIVFQHVNVNSRSEFAKVFLQKFTEYLRNGVKPRWIAAFIRQASAGGFKHIAESKFKSACLATVLTAARALKDLNEGNKQLRQQVVTQLADAIEKDISATLHANYDWLFMCVIFRTVLAIVPGHGLQKVLLKAAI